MGGLVPSSEAFPSLLDFDGAPIPPGDNGQARVLHAEGNHFINDNGHRTSPRKSKGKATPTPRATKTGAKAKTGPEKPKGRGSRSGKHARAAGTSDNEILALPEEEKKAAKIILPNPRSRRWSLEEKVILVEFIVSPENWGKVKTNLVELCKKVSGAEQIQ